MYRNKTPRTGFTLVEMLVVIVVIGILMGLILVAVVPALFTTYNAAVTIEINQLGGGLEKFKTQFGFFPPCEFDFDGDGDLDLGTNPGPTPDPEDLVTLKAYLRRIAPNHEQDDNDIATWWTDVGQYLDNDSIIVFWLGGLKKNAQFPLTNGNGGAAWDGFANGDDPANYIFFDFDGSQLVDGLSPRVKSYMQARYGEQPYVYYEWQRYTTAEFTDTAGIKYVPYRTIPESPDPAGGPPWANYYNPSTFQIVAAGKDVIFGTVTGANDVWTASPQFRDHRDNLTNFSGGILERLTQ